jgi:hypothetical protein
MRPLAIIFALLFFLLPLAHAQEHDGLSFSIESDLQRFDYREYSDQGKLLDRENGFLPGLLLGIGRSKGPWQIAGQLSYHAGGVAYTGQTNGGEPITTTTQQQIIDAELRAGYQFQQVQNIQPALYFGAANHSWRRNIQPTYTSSGMPVRGLMETYRWWQAFFGAILSTYKISSFDWALDTRLTRIIAPKIEVDYFGLYDTPQLDLGERWGFRLALPMSYSMRYSTTILLEPYLEKYALGRSSSTPLTNQGIIQGTVFEPRSTSSIYGVLLGIRKFF